jgi:hypothetical protein
MRHNFPAEGNFVERSEPGRDLLRAAANVMTEVCAPESKTARSLTPLTSTVPVVCDFHGPPSPRSSGIAEKGLTSA